MCTLASSVNPRTKLKWIQIPIAVKTIMDKLMTTHFISAEVHLHDTAEELHEAIEIELQKHGEPLRWAVTDVDVDRQKAVVEGYVLAEVATAVSPTVA